MHTLVSSLKPFWGRRFALLVAAPLLAAGSFAHNSAVKPNIIYNLADDPQETRDVIAGHPEVAAKLAALLETYRQQGHSRN